jgi:hypothetical protein
MSPVMMDPTWALLTLILTALLGMTLWLGMMVLIESRRVKKNVKRVSCVLAFFFYMSWLFTLGDPRSSVNLETLYYRSINFLPETTFTKVLKRQPTNTAVLRTNAGIAIQTNK